MMPEYNLIMVALLISVSCIIVAFIFACKEFGNLLSNQAAELAMLKKLIDPDQKASLVVNIRKAHERIQELEQKCKDYELQLDMKEMSDFMDKEN